MKSLLGLVFAAALLTGCVEPDGRDELEQAALELLDSHNGLSSSPLTKHGWSGHLAWLREQVGRCERVELDRSSESGWGFSRRMTKARFVFHCERGRLQAILEFDEDGRAKLTRMGARSIPPPDRVRAVADEWMASHSECRIDRVAISGLRGALFVLSCPTGEQTLRVELDRAGQPERIHVSEGSADDWRSDPNLG